MLRVRPFHALRPAEGLASAVASVPYDVCNREEALALAEGLPDSFLHVVRPEIDLPAETDPYSDVVYATAKRNLDRMIGEQTLVREAEASMYVYRQRMELEGEVLEQTGVVACCHVDDYRNEVIKKHEKTRPNKEDDRTRHVLTLGAHTGPVFILHRDEAEIAERVSAATTEDPLYDFVAPDGVHHSVWRVQDSEPLTAAYARLDAAYVADGHHRSASASRAAAEIATRHPEAGADAEHNWFLTVLFPASQLHIMAYNRYIRDLGDYSPAGFLEAMAAVVEPVPAPDSASAQEGNLGMYLDGTWYRMSWRESVSSEDPVEQLEHVCLFKRILRPLLDIQDVRSDPRIDFVGGIRGTRELERRVDEGGGVAFAMPSVTVDELMRVSDSGSIMPPKTTWFEPKLRSGLLVHMLD